VPFLTLNYEQEQAIRTSLQSDLTVITGPPGTGKSQIAANLLANLAASGQSAIFASRNHKALDAVVPRVNKIVPNETVLVRTRNRDTGEEFTWRTAINQILAAPVDADAEVDHAHAAAEIHDWLGRRDCLLEVAETWTALERELGPAQRTWDDKTVSLPSVVVDLIRSGQHLPAGDVLREMEHGLGAYPADERSRWGLWFLRLWWRLRHWPVVRSRLPHIKQAIAAFGMTLPPPQPTPPFLKPLGAVVGTLSGYAALHELHARIMQLQAQASTLRPLANILQETEAVLGQLRDRAPGLLHACLRRRFSRLAPQERQRLLQMRNTLDHARDTAIGEGARIRWQRFFQDQFDLLIRCFPLWAVPSLSARHGLPLAPAIADAAVLDEASQCDVASAIPLLYRTKRAVIIGDPNQLRPVHNMKPGRNRQLLRKHGLLTPTLAQFDFLQSSLYDLAAATPKAGEPVLLRDHFRCHPDIAAYCNSLVYKGQLRVLTDESRLRRPKGRKAGIAWTEVAGTAEAAAAGGAVCQEEIGAVGRELNRLLVEDRFDGTVGVVTPFKEQAKRVRDWAESNMPPDLLRKAEFVSATADGFQGDQRDVILCSPVYQPGLPRGAEWYVTSKDTRNLWNVAISRAQALLHVLGNREMCLQSDVNHLVLLAKLSLTPPSYDPGKPVFESVWERRLYDALVAVGVTPFTQYPLAGCRLDLAFRDACLDVEVDGERYHRDAQGRRKAEDLWRDLAIRAAGWTVLRFWVYELSEDMPACLRKIQDRLASLQEKVCAHRAPDAGATEA
jgi:very-short-patch-repair endonuclease